MNEPTEGDPADRRETVRVFRDRLAEAMAGAKLSQSALARLTGVDRSTLSQLLAAETTRLPRADTVASVARALAVSTDWLLGLSQERAGTTAIIQQSLEIERRTRFPVDDQIAYWWSQAGGSKIRYVPTNLPDMLKTEDTIRYEYRHFRAMTSSRALDLAHYRLTYARLPETDVEVVNATQEIETLARGEGIWRELPRAHRLAQLDRMIRLTDELYPSFRWFLYDGLETYATPYTIFGQQRAALYLGEMYFVANTTQHIRVLTRHFDTLIRAAIIQPLEAPDYLRRLRAIAEAQAG